MQPRMTSPALGAVGRLNVISAQVTGDWVEQ
jgi:hypothetical protein